MKNTRIFTASAVVAAFVVALAMPSAATAVDAAPSEAQVTVSGVDPDWAKTAPIRAYAAGRSNEIHESWLAQDPLNHSDAATAMFFSRDDEFLIGDFTIEELLLQFETDVLGWRPSGAETADTQIDELRAAGIHMWLTENSEYRTLLGYVVTDYDDPTLDAQAIDWMQQNRARLYQGLLQGEDLTDSMSNYLDVALSVDPRDPGQAVHGWTPATISDALERWAVVAYPIPTSGNGVRFPEARKDAKAIRIMFEAALSEQPPLSDSAALTAYKQSTYTSPGGWVDLGGGGQITTPKWVADGAVTVAQEQISDPTDFVLLDHPEAPKATKQVYTGRGFPDMGDATHTPLGFQYSIAYGGAEAFPMSFTIDLSDVTSGAFDLDGQVYIFPGYDSNFYGSRGTDLVFENGTAISASNGQVTLSFDSPEDKLGADYSVGGFVLSTDGSQIPFIARWIMPASDSDPNAQNLVVEVPLGESRTVNSSELLSLASWNSPSLTKPLNISVETADGAISIDGDDYIFSAADSQPGDEAQMGFRAAYSAPAPDRLYQSSPATLTFRVVGGLEADSKPGFSVNAGVSDESPDEVQTPGEVQTPVSTPAPASIPTPFTVGFIVGFFGIVVPGGFFLYRRSRRALA